MKEVLIIGGGVIGCAVARELSRYRAKITLLEKENDVACGTSKANSGIVHAGFDAEPGSQKARFNLAGNAMFDKLAEDLDFPFRRTGAIVACFGIEQWPELDKLYRRGLENQVPDLKIISGDEARAMIPALSESVTGCLYAPTSGIVGPYEMTIAYAENAAVNGADFQFGKQVNKVTKKGDAFRVLCADGSVYSADFVINCAGVYADSINNAICEQKLSITPRRGEYMLLDKTEGGLAPMTIFQLPTKMGKGILVTPTTHGNVILGPTARDIEDKDDVATTWAGLEEVFEKARKSVPALSKRTVITQFSGLRAHEAGGDFVIGESEVKGFYNVAGIESPGLTSAPAIGKHVADDTARLLSLPLRDDFVEKRKGIPEFAVMTDSERRAIVRENPLYGRVVCRCETVTEGEIVDSIRRPVGAKDLDGVKRRTRAGMGRCQSGFCCPRVMEILARELGVPMTAVTKNGAGSEILTGRVE